MLSTEKIRRQMERLTTDFVSVSLCNWQQYPSIKDIGHGYTEIGLSGAASISIALKNVPYEEMYLEFDRNKTYNLKMLVGALIQMSYRFRDDRIEAHRLAYFPSPNLKQFQDDPEIYLDDEIYAEVIERNIIPVPIRFDFVRTLTAEPEYVHPKSHLTLGQYKNCRIPVNSPLTPHQFLTFIIRNFYHRAYITHKDRISFFDDVFSETITIEEQSTLHVRVPANPE